MSVTKISVLLNPYVVEKTSSFIVFCLRYLNLKTLKLGSLTSYILSWLLNEVEEEATKKRMQYEIKGVSVLYFTSQSLRLQMAVQCHTAV